ncbi:hypothetical protein Salat_2614400 [Sesamum alatum]|uniref:Uncharacterized protein n=1 Tax=Sesamum alatum TaxID=300844 RepID=A0AAE1XNF2_9LAMI|nr:hypothetical protein Salat_2614400 [Sesamum alatum]
MSHSLGGNSRGVIRGPRIFGCFHRGSSSSRSTTLHDLAETVSSSISIVKELGSGGQLGFCFSQVGSEYLQDISNVGPFASGHNLFSNPDVVESAVFGQWDKAFVGESEIGSIVDFTHFNIQPNCVDCTFLLCLNSPDIPSAMTNFLSLKILCSKAFSSKSSPDAKFVSASCLPAAVVSSASSQHGGAHSLVDVMVENEELAFRWEEGL